MKNSFKHKVVTDRRDVARYFKALMEGFEKGSLELASGLHEFVLHPHEPIEMDIELRKQNGQGHLFLSFTWPDEEPRSGGNKSRDATPGRP